MLNVNATNFRKDIFNYLNQAIKYNQPINIATKEGNAVLLSEDDYRGLMETLYIESIPGLKESIVASMEAAKRGERGMDITGLTFDEIIAKIEKEDSGE